MILIFAAVHQGCVPKPVKVRKGPVRFSVFLIADTRVNSDAAGLERD